MRSGMKMMAVNEMRRRRDSRGRYMEGGSQMEMGYGRMDGGQMNQGNYNRMEGGGGRNRMEGGNSNRMGGYDRMESEMRSGMENEMRRGSRGGNRSEGGNSNRMEEGGASSHYWPGPHMPPYGDGEPEMRGGGRGGERRNNYDEGPSMGGYGGFVWNQGEDDKRMAAGGNIVDMRQYGKRRMAMGGNQEPMHQRMIGFASSKGEEKFDREVAEEWVAEMKGSDPAHPMGPKWTPEQVKPYAQKYGFPTEGEKFWEFYAIMNAMYADSFDTAKEFNLVKPEFFASLAKGWLNDKDAVPNKAQMYYECIVK